MSALFDVFQIFSSSSPFRCEDDDEEEEVFTMLMLRGAD